MWVATLCAIGLIFAPRLTRLITGTFTTLAGDDCLHLGDGMAQRSAQGLSQHTTKGAKNARS
ncbi:DUF1360 domain-containing protein [Mycobacterium simulans]|uniref:DUF1360 domain-containing protein n=1 Tax=Mycobacterium simulans TaxID=627089 RepID=UPI0021E521F8